MQRRPPTKIAPDKFEISKLHLFFDAASNLAFRSILSLGECTIFMLADSSPQFGTDWFITELYIVQDILLDNVVDAYFELISLVSLGDCLSAEQIQLRKDLTQEICKSILRHVLVPTGIGSRASSLADKLHCLLHQLYLLVGSWKSVFKHIIFIWIFSVLASLSSMAYFIYMEFFGIVTWPQHIII